MPSLEMARKLSQSALLALSAAIFCASLSSCGTILPGTPWSPVSKEGPLLLGNQRAQTLVRCAVVPAFMSKGPCEEAFVDHLNEKVAWLDVQEDVDAYLKRIPALAPWVGELRKDGTGVTMPYRREAPYRIPYRMHILTISPIVVLVTPNTNDQFNNCSAPEGEGCIPSPRTGAAFFYRAHIKAVSGSFVFSPDMPMEVTAIPSDSQHFEIKLPDSKLELVAENGNWKVQRNVRDR